MTRYWVLGLIAAAVAVLFLVRRVYSVSKSLEEDVDIPLWDANDHRRVDIWPEPPGERDDTTPAVLSPPEWKAPRSAANDSCP